MSAYLILTQTVDDKDRYIGDYVPAAVPFLSKHGGEVQVGDFAAEPAQGTPPEGVVGRRFPSKDAIRAFLDDPDYQPIKQLRLSITSNAHAVMANEFRRPG